MSRIYVDRISPYQSGSLTIDGFSPTIDTGSLVTTASFNAYTASAPTLGSNTFTGNQTINGTTGTPAYTFVAKDGNNTNRIQVQNSTLAGLTGFDMVLNGGTKHDGKLSVSGSLQVNDNTTFVGNATLTGTTGTPGQTLIVRDGTGTGRLEVNNSTLAGFTGIEVNLNGTVQITEVLKLNAQDPLPAGGVGQLGVSGSNLYYHNGSSWSQIN